MKMPILSFTCVGLLMKWQMTERRHLHRNGFNKAQLIVILGLLPIYVQVCVTKDTDCCQLVYHIVMSMIKTFRACMVVMTPNIKGRVL